MLKETTKAYNKNGTYLIYVNIENKCALYRQYITCLCMVKALISIENQFL